MNHNFAIIMAGGLGSRFWPTSTTHKPKQFLDVLNTGETLLQQTFRRVSLTIPKKNIPMAEIRMSGVPIFMLEGVFLGEGGNSFVSSGKVSGAG